MPAHHVIDNRNKLIVTTWDGDVVDIDLIEALTKYQQDIQGHPQYLGYNEIVDFSEVGKIKVTTEGIKNIGRIASTTDQNGIDRKLAFIVGSDLAFGLARMYEVYRGFTRKTNKEVRTFKNKHDAYEWVMDNQKEQ